MSGAADRRTVRRLRGGRARRDGRAAEVLAAFWLMLKGYRVLAFRSRIGGVEVDLVARRGQVLALVEVKRRAELDAARLAVTPDQRRRLLRAGQVLAERSRRGARPPPDVRLDLLALAPGRWPHHVPDAWAGAEETAGWR